MIFHHAATFSDKKTCGFRRAFLSWYADSYFKQRPPLPLHTLRSIVPVNRSQAYTSVCMLCMLPLQPRLGGWQHHLSNGEACAKLDMLRTISGVSRGELGRCSYMTGRQTERERRGSREDHEEPPILVDFS